MASAPPAASRAARAVDAHVVECAAQLFLARGIAAVRMTDIAADAGIGVATLYRHFSTKAAIAAEVGTLLWHRVGAAFQELVASEDYARRSGAERLELLLLGYCDAFVSRPGFASFVDEFDRLALAGDVTAEALGAYAEVVGAPYPLFEAAYQRGLADASIAREVDFALLYRSLAHALLSVACKLSRGEVIPTDDFSHGRDELDCLMDMAIRSLKTGV